MSDYAEKVRQIQRERVTEEKVRAKDASEIVDWVHALEDKVEALREALLDAIESYEEYSTYAGEYLCKKHRVAEHIQELRVLQEQGVVK